MPNIEYIKDIIERLETAEVIGDIDWDSIDDELVAMGLCHEDDAECDDEVEGEVDDEYGPETHGDS